MNNTKKKLGSKVGVVKSSFSSCGLTRFGGLNLVGKFLNREKVTSLFSESFPTVFENATKFGINQIMLSVVLASVSGINRINKIATFTEDCLVRRLLKLGSGINENAISKGLKKLGESGAYKLQEVLLAQNSKWLAESKLKTITCDADSTVTPVFGNQEGAAKGYNPVKKGAKSYHPLMAFVSELKMAYLTWFRTGSAYTSNGICEFVKEFRASLPTNLLKKVFFRADSGFFSGKLFDLLESFGWDYLVKVKLKNLSRLLEKQTWEVIDKGNDVAICEFEYQAAEWTKSRKLKAIRSVKEYVNLPLYGEVAVYQYACYISSYESNASELHEIYKQRSTSETWIEQVKGQVMAGSTLTNNFAANNILWQLSVFAYNVSVMMRKGVAKFKKQEHRTFVEWFILIPAKIIRTSRQIQMKIYKHHSHQKDWEMLDQLWSQIA